MKTKVLYRKIPEEERERINEILIQQKPDHNHIHNYWRFQTLDDGRYEISRLTWRPIQKENIDEVLGFLSRYFDIPIKPKKEEQSSDQENIDSTCN